jgi:hypothetical protein
MPLPNSTQVCCHLAHNSRVCFLWFSTDHTQWKPSVLRWYGFRGSDEVKQKSKDKWNRKNHFICCHICWGLYWSSSGHHKFHIDDPREKFVFFFLIFFIYYELFKLKMFMISHIYSILFLGYANHWYNCEMIYILITTQNVVIFKLLSLTFF